MAYAPKRGNNVSLDEGSTDGTYFKEHPNLEDPSGRNIAKIQESRRSLGPLNGYSVAVYPNPVNPGK